MTSYILRDEMPEQVRNELSAYPKLLQELLFYRGIDTGKDAEAFMHPDYEKGTYAPFLLKDMEKAVKRILEAIEKEEKIVIFSDFDADGIPGAVIANDFFQKIGYENYSVVIPHRNTEGFGLNERVVKECIDEKVCLVVTIDCGMGDSEHIAGLKKGGVDTIVTDHHRPNHQVPPAVAIVNPNQDGDEYPNKALCGAGVIFKVVQGLLEKGNFDISQGWDKWLLDMVGIATLSDMVSLTGENRVFAQYGLLVLRKSRRIGLRALLQKARVNQTYLTEDDVAFMVTPRINAASRMDEPEIAFRLLATTDHTEAEELVKHLDELNNKRKGAVAAMSKDIHKRIAKRETMPDVLVIGDPHWKPGLLGLAATKAVELYKRPVFVWGRGDAKVIKGSVRSYNGADVVALMHSTQELFLEYGGHTKSGGFSTTVEHIVQLEEKINDLYTDTASSPEEEVFVDATASLDDVSWQTYDTLAKLQPFGMDNSKPLFLFEAVSVFKVEHFGKEQNHLKYIFQNSAGDFISAIQFFFDPDSEVAQVKAGDTINLLAHIEKSVFGGRPEVRLRIVDI